MRELKFRAWDREQMVSPDYITRDGIAHWYANSIPESSNVVMQYTGLHDKNGREIYESDNLKSMRWFPLSHAPLREQREIEGYVCWDDRSFGWELKTKEDEFCLFELIEPVVIGNIYENPELMKEEL